MNRRSFLSALPALFFSGGFLRCFAAPKRPIRIRCGDDCTWAWWRNLPRTLLTESDDPFAAKLIQVAAHRGRVRIRYSGGSDPGATRSISPLGVFSVDGYEGIYVTAICHERNAERTFRSDRIEALA